MVDTEVLFRIADAAEGEGNLQLARQSFERGASLGSVECLTRLAYIYDVGLGVEADKALAMRLYQRAWRRGREIVAANNIAILYRERGDHRAMFKWFCRAADEGDGSAALDMAKCYLTGHGAQRDQAAALRCLASALQSVYISEAEREEATALMAGFAPYAV